MYTIYNVYYILHIHISDNFYKHILYNLGDISIYLKQYQKYGRERNVLYFLPGFIFCMP